MAEADSGVAGTAIVSMVALQVTKTIEVASIGIPDTLLLMLLALVVFGPRRLPEIGRQIGKLMYEFRKVSNDFKFQMEEELRASEEADRQKKLQVEQEAARKRAEEDAKALGEGDMPAAANVGAESAEVASAVDGEVRGEPRKFPPVLPPSSGETVAAARPFRTYGAEETPQPDEAAAATHEGESEVTNAPEVKPETEQGCEIVTITEEGQEVHHA